MKILHKISKKGLGWFFKRVLFKSQLFLKKIISTPRNKILREFAIKNGYFSSFKNPKTFKEFIFRNMCYPTKKITQCVDKWFAKKYVSSKIGPQFVAEILYDGPLEKLPDLRTLQPCAVKSNHGSGGHTFVCGNKMTYMPMDNYEPIKKVEDYDHQLVISRILTCLSYNYAKECNELQYVGGGGKPRFYVERFESDHFATDEDMLTKGGPVSIKCYTFGYGRKVIVCWLNHDGDASTYFDEDGNNVTKDFGGFSDSSVINYEPTLLPVDSAVYQQFVSIARDLGSEFDFVRLDLFYLKEKNKILFAEYSFTPMGGNMSLSAEIQDYLGSIIRGEDVSFPG